MKSLIEEIDLYCKNVRLKKSTIKAYLYRLNDFSSYLSELTSTQIMDIYLDKIYLEKDLFGLPIRYLPIDNILIEDYLKSIIPKGYSTLCASHKALRSFFSFLERNYYFDNPFEKITFRISDYEPQKQISKILTRSGIIKFLNAIINHSDDIESDLLLFTILLSTGCRISEVLNLKCEDIDVSNDSFTLKDTKNNDQRVVNLRPNVGSLINTFTTYRGRTPTDNVFLNRHAKKLVHSEVDKLFKHYLQLAKLPPLNLHSLRSTFATLMADENTPITIIQQLIGHRSLASTEGYINPNYVRNRDFIINENELIWSAMREILKNQR